MKAILQENNQILLTLPADIVEILKAKVGDKFDYEMQPLIKTVGETISLLELKKSHSDTIRSTLDQISDRLNEDDYLKNVGFNNEEDVIDYIRNLRRDENSF